jgi:hypothetical protein
MVMFLGGQVFWWMHSLVMSFLSGMRGGIMFAWAVPFLKVIYRYYYYPWRYPGKEYNEIPAKVKIS